MNLKQILKDITLFTAISVWIPLSFIDTIFVFPIIITTIPLMGLLLYWTEVDNRITRLKIRWGVHTCSNGHTYKKSRVEESVITRTWMDEDGISANICDVEKYRCENCFSKTHKYVNERIETVPFENT